MSDAISEISVRTALTLALPRERGRGRLSYVRAKRESFQRLVACIIMHHSSPCTSAAAVSGLAASIRSSRAQNSAIARKRRLRLLEMRMVLARRRGSAMSTGE